MSAIAIARQLLLTDSAVTGLVGTRVYPVTAAQGAARPHIVLHLITTVDIGTHLGGAGKYYRTRFQADCIGDTATQVLDLGEAVIGRLNGGAIKSRMLGCRDIDCLLGETDFTENTDQADSFRRVLQFNMTWRRNG